MTKSKPISVWPALVRAYQDVRHDADEAVRQFGLASLQEYDVLLELRRANGPLTLSELESRTLLRQYQLSRLVDRLVRRGLVQRTIAEDDARARLVTLSKEGRLIQKQAGGAYHKVLERRILDRLDAGELEEMTTWLRRIAAG